MVQLRILSGQRAGTSWVTRRFPVRIGRATGDLTLDEPGVWENHATLQFVPRDGIYLESNPEAITSVNGQRVERTRLRNGDQLDLGGVRLQFWLSETRQRNLAWREALTWAGTAAVTLGQLVLVYYLLRS